jgi:D-alanine-D-alanine ligase
MAKKLKVALIFGGTSEERKVSLESAKNAKSVLSKKYELIPIEISADRKWLNKLNQVADELDLAFLALHGPGGEDGTVQAVLDLLGIKYTCSGTMASAIAMDKVLTKKLVATDGILVAPHVLITKEGYRKHPVRYLKMLKGKLVVKPNRIGSSMGVTISDEPIEVKKGIERALAIDDSILVEKFMKGREFTVPVLGNNHAKALPVIEIIPKISEFFDFKAKYKTGGSDEIVPAKIDKKLTEKFQKIALRVHKLLGCRGMTRSDFILTDEGRIVFLEINTIPGMTANSLVPKSALASGISFPKLLDKLIALALDKE